MSQPTIEGVQVKQLTTFADDRGSLMELLRADDPQFAGFGQAYLSISYPGVIRAWHHHRLQTDAFVCVRGMIKVPLYDSREDSPTHGLLREYFLGDQNRIMLFIPPGVMHGFKVISHEPAYLLNFPTVPYNRAEPDEYRLPYDTDQIPYDWAIKFH
jgi:dTDP-4-dehydrorhamnose 3,5-epimerase